MSGQEKRLHTLCIRCDTQITSIEYHPAAFFAGKGASPENAMDVKRFFERELGISCELLKQDVGVENILAEEIFFRAHKRRWKCLGDCVVFAGRSLTPEEEAKLRDYLERLRGEVIAAEERRSEEESAYWESIYDTARANALVVAPDGGLTPVHLTGELQTAAEHYFSRISEEAYPVLLEGENVRYLNESLAGQFRLRLMYDKMAYYMNGRMNPFTVWISQDAYTYGDLLILGENEAGAASPLTAEELAAAMKLIKALQEYRRDQEGS